MKRLFLLLALLLSASPAFASFTFYSNGGVAASASATTIATTAGNTPSVHVGDLVVCYVTWEGTASTGTLSDGTSSFTVDPAGYNDNPGSSGEPHGVFFYLPSSAVSGINSIFYTFTFDGGASRAFRSINCGTWVLTASVSFVTSKFGAASSGTAATSGNYTSTGTDGLAVAGYAEYGASIGTLLINGASPDGSFVTSGASGRYTVWYQAYAAGYTNAASGTLSGSNRWDVNAIVFSIGGTPPPTCTPSLTLINVGAC